ncbi:MAG TPA: AAA family ATPase [Candidatus Poseidoniales archaeon]|nr:AAA family ATPase [Candidatus Poseidoniales archaeon]
MTSLSELEAIKTHQADTTIIQDYPLVSFTTVSSETSYMTKTYSYDQASDELIKERAGSPVDGTFYRVNNLSLYDLFEHFGYLTKKEALIHGTIKDHEQVGICTKNQPIDGCMTRTKDNFSYPDNALMLLDHDPSDRGYKISSADNFIDTLELIDPQLKSCAYFYKSSASSGIRLNGKLLNDNTGIHVYLVIPGGQLKSYAEILFKRCILNDLGHIFISKNGRKYIRTIFDAAVHGPERIDYIAPAIINKPLEIDEPVSSSRPGNSIDGSLLSRLTPEEEVSYQDKHKKLLSDAEDDAFDVLYKYVKDQSKTTGIAAERLMRFHAMGDQGVIDFGHPLTKDDGTQFSFADVVADPGEYKNLSMPDPFDPADGPSKAQLYVNDNGTIVINSFAHGSTVYKLHQDGKLYTGKTSKDRREFKMIGPAEILAKSPVPNWLIKSYIIQGSVAQIIAKSEAGKSFATIDIGLSIATGQDWNNCKVAQGPVAYLNSEGYSGITTRIQGWQQEHQSILHAPFLLSTEALDLTDDTAVANAQKTLDKFAQEHDGHISLIVVDTMHKSMSGDEDSSNTIRKFVNNLDKLCSYYGAAALINHHPGYGNIKRARGSSAQFAAMDAQLLITKKNSKFQLECTKLKDGGKKPDPVGFELREIQLPELDEDGEHVTTCIPEYIPLSGQQSTRAVKLKPMSEGLTDTLKSFGNVLKSNGATEASKDDWRDELVTLRTFKDPNRKKDITAAKKVFSRGFDDLIDAGVVCVNDAGSYQYGEDIEPQWSDVKAHIQSKHFK